MSYGTRPNLPGALKYAHDASVASALPFYKQILKAESRPLYSRKGVTFLRVLPPVFVLIAICLAGYAFYRALIESTPFGQQSVLIDASNGYEKTPAGDPAYYLRASTVPIMQQWSIRQGQYGREQEAEFTIPDAQSMQDGAVIYVRNTSIDVPETADEASDKYYPARNCKIMSPGLPLFVLKAKNSIAYIAAESNGVKRWYNALPFDGIL